MHAIISLTNDTTVLHRQVVAKVSNLTTGASQNISLFINVQIHLIKKNDRQGLKNSSNLDEQVDNFRF
jgi:hypothetical protein